MNTNVSPAASPVFKAALLKLTVTPAVAVKLNAQGRRCGPAAKGYLHHIFQKVGVRNRTPLADMAFQFAPQGRPGR